MTINFGLIGCGYISKRHLHALGAINNAKLIAVSDLNKERMENAIREYKDISNQDHPILIYENSHDLIENNDVDVVVICTISGIHAELAKLSLIAGKHVILEKPMTLSLKEADEINQLAEMNNCVICVCHQMRFRPIMREIKHVIEAGKIGTPYLGAVSIRINRTPEYYTSAPWRGKWETDGGMLVNQGIHVIDLMQWFLGDVKKVFGEISSFSNTKETEDIALGILTFDNQAKGVIEANVITQPQNLGYQLSIFGEKGCISIEGPSLNKITRWHIDNEPTNYVHLEQLLNDQNEQIYMYENFIRAIQCPEEKLLVDGYEGKKALETIFAIYHSSLIKNSVYLPLTSFSTVNMKTEGDAE